MDVKSESKVTLDCKQGLIKAVRFNADGQYALTCGSDRTIKLWRPNKLLELNCYKGHSADVVDCQANEDGSQFTSCSYDRSIIVWDIETGKVLRRFRNLVGPFNSICYGRSAGTVLGGSVDGTVRIYDLRALNAWEPIQSLTEASDSVTCCRTHDHMIFTTSLDKSLRSYDIRKGQLHVDQMSMPLNHVALNQGAESLLVTCLRGPPLLIDRNKATIINEYSGNDSKLFKIESTFAMNDSYIVSGSEDGNVYIWDTINRTPRSVLRHPNLNSPVIQSISSDSLDYLLTACANYIFLWSL